MGIGPPPSTLSTSEDGLCISGASLLTNRMALKPYSDTPEEPRKYLVAARRMGQDISKPGYRSIWSQSLMLYVGSTRSLSVGSVGSAGAGSEPSTPTRLSEVLSAASFRKAIVKKGNSLKSLKSLILESEPRTKSATTSKTEVCHLLLSCKICPFL